ncbi:MAG: hypothetical protein IPM42_11415 [Saprospiraceae bacterium]|nr:hypothetical protein [Saprospiraceae bacterium]
MLTGEDGANINGPSLIKVPGWIENPLGKYYLYFAHHSGKYIRMAYADDIKGPWKMYEPGTLRMEDCPCTDITNGPPNHIASPDVHIDEASQTIVMYYHCPVILSKEERPLFDQDQVTLRATSHDGLHFASEDKKLGDFYFRVFKWNEYHYAIARLGLFYRSKNGKSDFEKGPNPFQKLNAQAQFRHSAVLIKNDILYVFYSRIGDQPERILLSKIDLSENWNNWTVTDPVTVLAPELDYEGGNLPLTTSKVGASKIPVRELRDPGIFEENGKIYLLYSIAGELGIASAEIMIE